MPKVRVDGDSAVVGPYHRPLSDLTIEPMAPQFGPPSVHGAIPQLSDGLKGNENATIADQLAVFVSLGVGPFVEQPTCHTMVSTTTRSGGTRLTPR
jgi:hypothetical protein